VKTDVGTQAVRHRFGLGRLLPLGGPADGTWITEQAAVQALGRVVSEIPGVRPESLRIGPAPLGSVSEPAFRPPASAIPRARSESKPPSRHHSGSHCRKPPTS
jgi:hypothetical protein